MLNALYKGKPAGTHRAHEQLFVVDFMRLIAALGIVVHHTRAYFYAPPVRAAAALVVTGRAEDLKSGAELAAAVIDDGRAAAALAELVRASHAPIEDEDA